MKFATKGTAIWPILLQNQLQLFTKDMATHPNIDRVNELLKNPELNLPIFRQRIDASGHNVKFVRKVVTSHPKAPEELKTLLAMKDKDLMKVASA